MRPWLLLIAVALANPSTVSQADPAQDGPMVHPAGPIYSDGKIRDSIGAVTVRAKPDTSEATPGFLLQVDYLRDHHDNVQAIDYLRQVVMTADILPQDRARAILELADCLQEENQDAEAICWLKIWMLLFPTRPEMGAITYRMGAIYTKMGLPNLARDAYYLTLAHTVNEGQVKDADDLKQYIRLTNGTLWAMAANEYESGQWARAAELLDRYQKEATAAPPIAIEKAAFLQADCYYQLRQVDDALKLYEATLKAHPFNPIAPQARLRLYHLYVMKNEPQKARDEMEALVWTVRTVWPQDETFWQRQTAQFLLAINKDSTLTLPPLVAKSAQIPSEGKPWQGALDHYDALVGFQAIKTHITMDSLAKKSGQAGVQTGLSEEQALMAANRRMDELLPPRTASTQQ